MNKWYMHNAESFLENEMHKLRCDFEIQMDYLISARRPDIVIVKKKQKKKKTNYNLPNSRFCRSGWPQDKTKEKRNKR